MQADRVPAADPPPSSTRPSSCGCRAGSSSRTAGISSTRGLIKAGFSISRAFSAGCRQRHQAVADQVGGGLMARIQQEDAVVQQFLLGQSLAILCSPWIRRVSTSRSGSPARCAAARPESQGSREILHRAVAARKGLGADHGLQAPRIASDQPRSGSRSSSGTPSRLPITSIGIGGGEVFDQIDVALAAIASSSRSTNAIRSGSISDDPRGDSAPMISRRTRVCAGGSLKTRLVVWCS